jgi:hypothetical protein
VKADTSVANLLLALADSSKPMQFWKSNGCHYGKISKITLEVVPCGKKNAVKVEVTGLHPPEQT